MATHQTHHIKETFYFVTFTCYKWLPLIQETNLYDYFVKWFSKLTEKGVKPCGYVIMPNHLHLLVFVENNSEGLNKVIGESKRFMAYEIVKRLTKLNHTKTLSILKNGVQAKEKTKGKKHQVFRLSFDAKELRDDCQIINILDYIHHNPVNKKWNLVDNYTDYPYSSASFYELEIDKDIKIFDYRKVFSASSSNPQDSFSESSSSDSEGH